MKSNRKKALIFTPDADLDIVEIFQYTIEIWGISQAKKHRQEIFSKIELLEKTPFIGSKTETFVAEVFQIQIFKHTVYYQVKGDAVLILRILHQNRDVLDDEFSP